MPHGPQVQSLAGRFVCGGLFDNRASRLAQSMAHRPTLAEFVEQELRLAESTFAAVVDEVVKRWHDRAPLQRQSAELQALRVLQAQRGDFLRGALQSLHEQAALKAERPGSRVRKAGKLELSLVDDDEVTADIEVARVVERCDADLEDPLRELRTYTSALAGDVNAARDTNPLRPEVWVRAPIRCDPKCGCAQCWPAPKVSRWRARSNWNCCALARRPCCAHCTIVTRRPARVCKPPASSPHCIAPS
jgi:hypothetical protein